MLTRNRLFAFSLPLLAPDPGNPPGGEGNPPTPPTPPKPDKPEFDDAQQQYINGLLAKERKTAEEKTALRLQEEAAAKAKAEEEQRERDEAAKRGEFDKVRTELEGKVSSVEQERDSLATERDALKTYFEDRYAAALKDLPEPILAFKPADDASIETKTQWLATAQEQAGKLAGVSKGGNPPNPRVAHDQREKASSPISFREILNI